MHLALVKNAQLSEDERIRLAGAITERRKVFKDLMLELKKGGVRHCRLGRGKNRA